mgnify:CR=1 FL=1
MHESSLVEVNGSIDQGYPQGSSLKDVAGVGGRAWLEGAAWQRRRWALCVYELCGDCMVGILGGHFERFCV